MIILSVGDLHRPEEDAGVDFTSTIWIAGIVVQHRFVGIPRSMIQVWH